MNNELKERFATTQAKGIERLKMYSAGILYFISKFNPEQAEQNLMNLLINEKLTPSVRTVNGEVLYTAPFVLLMDMCLDKEELDMRFKYLTTDGKAEFLEMLKYDDILDEYHPDYKYLDKMWGQQVDSKVQSIICNIYREYKKMNPYDLLELDFFCTDEKEIESAKTSIELYDRLKYYRVQKKLCNSTLSSKVKEMLNKHKELCAKRDQYDIDVHMKMLNESLDRLSPYLKFIPMNIENSIPHTISLLEDRLKETLLSEELIDTKVAIERERFVVEEPIIIPIITQAESQDESLDELDLDIDLDL